MWTVLCFPWELFAVKTLLPGTNMNTHLYSILSRVDVYMELFKSVKVKLETRLNHLH